MSILIPLGWIGPELIDHLDEHELADRFDREDHQ